MNYLGHVYLSFGDADIVTGNMIGDYVKGRLALEKFPERVKKGVLLHRKIDSFADEHPACRRAMLWFREDYGLYSSAIIDTLLDHFLANDPKIFLSEQHLLDFTKQTYLQVQQNSQYLPERFALLFPYMQEHNWLYNYRTMHGMQRSLKGLERRAKYLGSTDKAYEIFVTYYYQLAQCYYEFIDDVVKFVKLELSAGHTF